MSRTTRRDFLQRSSHASLGLAAGSVLAERARAAAGPNEKIVLAMVGVGGRGNNLARDFAARDDCEIAYVCDVNKAVLRSRARTVEEACGRAPQTVTDFRKVLDDKAVDAIVVATPDHWHALAAVWGCQARKHVYVEKPASHTPWEGRQMVEAARKYDRIVQVGLQNRSAQYNRKAREYIANGELGQVHMVRVVNQRLIPNVPEIADSQAPAALDFDMWTGPAPEAPYNKNHHNHWNHFWRFSGGDIINDGVHQMDLARWLIGKDYPKTVYSVGGRFDGEGALESPDTQVAVFEFDDLVMTFELTLYAPYMIKSDAALRDSDMFPYWPQNSERIEIYGSKGLMYAGRHGCGWQVFERPYQRKPVLTAELNGPFPDPEHKQNFCDAVRGLAPPSADIEQGHRSTFLCQIANISYRLGGEKLFIDPVTESFLGNDKANAMLRREYRAPWVIPEKV